MNESYQDSDYVQTPTKQSFLSDTPLPGKDNRLHKFPYEFHCDDGILGLTFRLTIVQHVLKLTSYDYNRNNFFA